jgi:L-rhamnose mutarotase
MRIFLRDRHMFMYIETDDTFDPAVDFARINEDPVSAEWNALMATLQERAPEATPEEWWAVMEPVFDLASQLRSVRDLTATGPGGHDS